MFQFLQAGEQVGHGCSPAIQAPHHNNVDLPAPCRFHHFFATLPLCCTGADLFHLHGNGPATPGGIFAHGAALHGQGLLVVGGDAGIKAGAGRSFRSFTGVAKNPSRFGLCETVLRSYHDAPRAWPQSILSGHVGFIITRSLIEEGRDMRQSSL